MSRAAKKLCILVADDHELIRRGIRGLLCAPRGWKVVGEAANGREAIEKANKLRPDIAIVDLTMPDLDGLQATRKIRSEEHTSELQSRQYLVCRLLLEKKKNNVTTS